MKKNIRVFEPEIYRTPQPGPGDRGLPEDGIIVNEGESGDSDDVDDEDE